MIEIIDDAERIEHAIDGSWFTLRRMDADTHAEIVRRNTVRRKNRQGEWEIETNQGKVMIDCIDHIIIGWANIRHPVTKQDVPCTRENKIRLPVKIMHELTDVVFEASEARGIEAAAQLKNSKGSSA